jgi:hypothetical protein
LHVASALYYDPYRGRRDWLARTLYAPIQIVIDLLTRRRLLAASSDFEHLLSQDPAFALEEGMSALLSRRAQTYPAIQSSLLRAIRSLPSKRARSQMTACLLRTWLNTAPPQEARLAYGFVKKALCSPPQVF